MCKNLIDKKKREILNNINYAKEANINKVSVIVVNDNEEIQNQLICWLINEGYKVALIKEDVNIITIEW